jgi:hypothetical protein
MPNCKGILILPERLIVRMILLYISAVQLLVTSSSNNPLLSARLGSAKPQPSAP